MPKRWKYLQVNVCKHYIIIMLIIDLI